MISQLEIKALNVHKHRIYSIGVSAIIAALVMGASAAVLAQDEFGSKPFTGDIADASRGKVIVESRQQGLCVLCHQLPGGDERFQGNLAPTLAGVGQRLTQAQLRARMIDSRSINPESIMPAYFRSYGYERLAPALQGKTLLTAQQIEDVVAYLKGL